MNEKELLNSSVRKRHYTRILLDALASQKISKDEALAMLLNYVNDEDVECALRDSNFIETDESWVRPKGCR